MVHIHDVLTFKDTNVKNRMSIAFNRLKSDELMKKKIRKMLYKKENIQTIFHVFTNYEYFDIGKNIKISSMTKLEVFIKENVEYID